VQFWTQHCYGGGLRACLKIASALDFAEAMTRYDRGVDDDILSTLKQHFDGDVIIELAGLAAFQNLSRKFNQALEVPAQEFCLIPAAT
jgi:hypothetical protein